MKPCIQPVEGFHNSHAGVYRPLGIVLVRARIVEVHEQPISQILRHGAVVTPYDGHAHRLIVAQYSPQLFGIEPLRKRSRADEITEHDSELATLGFRGRACCSGTATRLADTCWWVTIHGLKGIRRC